MSTVKAINIQHPSSASVNLALTSGGATTVNGAFTLPTADGAANTVLSTNGAGTASWVAHVTSLVAGNGITVSAATGDVTVSFDYYTGTSATNTSYPIGTILFVVMSVTMPNLNASKTLYVANTAGVQVFDATSAGRTALTGTWRSRGAYNGLAAITAIDWAGSSSTTTTYYFGIFQRTA